jgi:glutaconate CoA-transferase, subunit B
VNVIGPPTTVEIQTIAAARSLIGKRSCFIGVGRPSTAAILAREIHNPALVLVYESGTIGAKPRQVPLSIGDGVLADTADFVVAVPEMFNYWIGAGRIQVAFLGAAQVDRHANLNSTVIGDYNSPLTRLPGAGGAPEIATGCPEVVVILPHSPRTLVPQLDFLTTTGTHTTMVITDLGVLEPNPTDGELVLKQLHPGVTFEQAHDATGWELKANDNLSVTPLPTDEELETLRELVQRGRVSTPAMRSTCRTTAQGPSARHGQAT